jgi:flagellar transcriptional activator FlhC
MNPCHLGLIPKEIKTPDAKPVIKGTAASRSLLAENHQIGVAIRLIHLGARLQMLEAETKLPYERLLKLYKEVAGHSPPKGQLPFSTDWFVTWQPNIHASLFYSLYEYLQKASDIDSLEAVIKAYQLYQAELASVGVDAAMSITRAWRLVKFVDCGMLGTTKCTRCAGQFINHAYELSEHYLCGLCAPPARAGKSRGKHAIH